MQTVSTYSTPSENILKLRALISQIDKTNSDELNYKRKKTINELKQLFNTNEFEKIENDNLDFKLNYYETLYSKISKILKQIND